MTAGETAYDAVAYPAAIFPQTHPAHLAAIARLHGLSAPRVETARVLEIAGGDGLNLVAMAAAYPDASFLSFDLSATAVARGAALVRAAKLDNIRVEVADLMDRAALPDGPFDYVIAHGLYAWVPQPVQQATMALIGRVLSPDGIAFLSYNTLPGGHLRRVVREMMLHHVGDEADIGQRLIKARSVLAEFAQPHEGDRPVLLAMRDVARPMLKKSLGALFHDELGDVYDPQSLTQVVSAAAEHGLAFLNDAGPTMFIDGFPEDATSEAEVVRVAQASDYASMAFFHQTLLVRSDRHPARKMVPAGLSSLFGSSRVERIEQFVFSHEGQEFRVEEASLADALTAMSRVWPERLPLERFAASGDHADALVKLWAREIIGLYGAPLPATVAPSERPLASPVARAQIAAGQPVIYTLDHRMLHFEAPGPRAFVALLDGTRDRARIAADWAASPFGHEVDADTALAQIARAPLLVA